MKYSDNFSNILLPILEKYIEKYGYAEIYKYFFEILDENKQIFQQKYHDSNGQKMEKRKRCYA